MCPHRLYRRSDPLRDLDLFREAFLDICTRFARMIAKDGEGAKHLVTCTVQGASTEE